jgi:hypothetical protein
MTLLETYLQYLNEFMPTAAIAPARAPAGYKQAPGPVNTDEEEVEETSYNPDGSAYGFSTFQRYSSNVGSNPGSVYPSQKDVNKKVKITVDTGKDEDDEETD